MRGDKPIAGPPLKLSVKRSKPRTTSRDRRSFLLKHRPEYFSRDRVVRNRKHLFITNQLSLSMNAMVSSAAKPLSRNPLALAAVYKDGLGTAWQNQKEAAAVLARMNVNRAHVNRAVRTASMPEAVLRLLELVEVTNETARELIRLENALGRGELERRAERLESAPRPWREVIADLDGVAATAKRRRATRALTPLERAAAYAEGIAANLWSTVTQASALTGWDRTDLSRSIAVSKLPRQILDLFDGRTFTVELADTLLAFQRSLGLERLVRNAEIIRERPMRRTRDELLNALAGARSSPHVKFKLRGRTSKITFEFTFDVEEAERVLLELGTLESMVEKFIRNSPRRAP
jgi:hypothetical protein